MEFTDEGDMRKLDELKQDSQKIKSFKFNLKKLVLKHYFLDPPCTTILSQSDLAQGMKFSTSRVQQDVLKDSDMIDP